MGILKHLGFWTVCALAAASAVNTRAATVSYTLENVFLADGAQMTGAFDWTYTPGDFEA